MFGVKRTFFILLVIMMTVLGAVAAQDASDDELLGAVPGYETWADVLAAAQGTTVNWHMWGQFGVSY